MGKQRTLQRNRKRDELTAKQYEYNMLYLKYKLLALDIFQWNNILAYRQGSYSIRLFKR